MGQLGSACVQVNLSPDSYLYRMNDVSRELYIVAGGVVELLIEQDDQLDFIESTRSAGQVCSSSCCAPYLYLLCTFCTSVHMCLLYLCASKKAERIFVYALLQWFAAELPESYSITHVCLTGTKCAAKAGFRHPQFPTC